MAALLIDLDRAARSEANLTFDWMRARWHAILGLMLTVGLLWPLVAAPYFSHDDNVQTMRIYEMHACLADGQIPCRWVPDLGGGYGYPEFNYYAPLAYYVGAGLYQIAPDILVAAKLTFALAFVLAFFSMYTFASLLWGRLGGALSAVYFVFAPYHALNMYHRGAMGELWATALLPFVFWAFLRLSRRPNRWNSLLLGLTAALLVLSHNLTAALVVSLVAIIGIAQFWSRKQFGFAKHLVGAGLWAVGFSAFYVFPVALENQFVHIETMTLNEYNYHQHFQNLRDLLVERAWWSASNSSGVSHQIGGAHVFVWMVSLIALFVFWRTNKRLRLIVAGSSVLILACMFMMNPASVWIWDRVTYLSYLQFPWRLMTLLAFAISVLAGSTLLLAQTQRSRVIAWSGLVAIVVIMNFGWFVPDRFLQVDQAKLLSGDGWDNLRMFAISDFLPRSAQTPPEKPASALTVELAGQADSTHEASGSNWLQFDESSASPHVVQINRYDFPTWDVTVDGQPAAYDHDPSSGALRVLVPAGMHHVEAHLRDTPVRSIGNMTSAAAVVAAAAMCLAWVVGRRRTLIPPQLPEYGLTTAHLDRIVERTSTPSAGWTVLR